MILKKLKESTRDQHDDLESTVDVMNQTFTIEDYKTLMSKFYRFYAAMEPELAKLDWETIGYDFDERQKLGKLENDLRNLGLEPSEVSNGWNDIPKVDNLAKALGAAYVIEGATLGGQLIKRHLKENLEITPENGGSFFNGYGELTGPKWKEFGAVITKYNEENGGDEETIEAARSTFDSFKRCFESA